MAYRKHTKAHEEAYRRAYHQAVDKAVRLLETGIKQQVDPEQILALFRGWEQKIAIWRGALETGRLLDPPPSAGEPRLRLVEREDNEPEDEQVDPRLREIIARARGIPRWRVRLRSSFGELRMTGVPNLMYLAEALAEIEKTFSTSLGAEALERFASGTVGELQAHLEGEE